MLRSVARLRRRLRLRRRCYALRIARALRCAGCSLSRLGSGGSSCGSGGSCTLSSALSGSCSLTRSGRLGTHNQQRFSERRDGEARSSGVCRSALLRCVCGRVRSACSGNGAACQRQRSRSASLQQLSALHQQPVVRLQAANVQLHRAEHRSVGRPARAAAARRVKRRKPASRCGAQSVSAGACAWRR
jgi:hypothetical protein